MIALETRPIFAVFSTEDGGKEYVPVVAWVVLPNTIHPQALVIPPKSIKGYGATLAYPDDMNGFERLEYIEPESKIIVPVRMNGSSGTQSFVVCPNGKGGEYKVHEWKLWKVVLAFKTDGNEAFSYRRWTQTGEFTRADIRAILFLLNEYNLCSAPSERHRTDVLPGVCYEHLLAFVARITKGVPPTQLGGVTL